MDVNQQKTYVVLRQHPDLEMYWQTTGGSSYHKQTGGPHPDNDWPPKWLDTLSITTIVK